MEQLHVFFRMRQVLHTHPEDDEGDDLHMNYKRELGQKHS